MSSGQSPLTRRLVRILPAVSLWIVLTVILLLFAVSGQALAASGSTRLTIHLDQSAVDAIARWKGEAVAERPLQYLLPLARAGLETTHHPQTTARILRDLRTDALLVFDGRAEHAGSSCGSCVLGTTAGGFVTVHSI